LVVVMGALVDSSANTNSPRLVDTHTVGKLLAWDAVTPAAEQPAENTALTFPAAFFAQTY
jgi:hypothetical protein